MSIVVIIGMFLLLIAPGVSLVTFFARVVDWFGGFFGLRGFLHKSFIIEPLSGFNLLS